MIERLRVRIPAGAAGEFSSPELTLCADSYSVSVPPPCYRSGTQKTPVVLQKGGAGAAGFFLAARIWGEGSAMHASPALFLFFVLFLLQPSGDQLENTNSTL